MLQDIPTPTPLLRETRPFVLETERLTLRKPTLADVKAIADLANDRRIALMTRRLPHPYTQDDAIHFVKAIAGTGETVFLIENNHTPVGVAGVDDPSALKRCNSTPLHWKPHFSSTLRDFGLTTRAPEII